MKKLIKLLLVIIVMTTIFILSNDDSTASTKKSDRFIVNTTELIMKRKLTNKERKKYISNYVVIARKTAHFTLYFLLGLTFINFLKEFNIDDQKKIIYSIVFVFLYACSDEIHQLFINGRSAEILDVLIDTMGGTISTLISMKRFKVRRRLSE